MLATSPISWCPCARWPSRSQAGPRPGHGRSKWARVRSTYHTQNGPKHISKTTPKTTPKQLWCSLSTFRLHRNQSPLSLHGMGKGELPWAHGGAPLLIETDYETLPGCSVLWLFVAFRGFSWLSLVSALETKEGKRFRNSFFGFHMVHVVIQVQLGPHEYSSSNMDTTLMQEKMVLSWNTAIHSKYDLLASKWGQTRIHEVSASPLPSFFSSCRLQADIGPGSSTCRMVTDSSKNHPGRWLLLFR